MHRIRRKHEDMLLLFVLPFTVTLRGGGLMILHVLAMDVDITCGLNHAQKVQ